MRHRHDAFVISQAKKINVNLLKGKSYMLWKYMFFNPADDKGTVKKKKFKGCVELKASLSVQDTEKRERQCKCYF